MARLKRGSPVLDTARQRLAGLKSITTAPDFGAGLTLATYESEITAFSTGLESYNEELSAMVDQKNTLERDDVSLREKNRRILAATEAKFGPDSSQVEQVQTHKALR